MKKETPMPNFNTVVTLAALTLIISLVEMLNLQKLEISKNNLNKKENRVYLLKYSSFQH
jgi:hypothetical protein